MSLFYFHYKSEILRSVVLFVLDNVRHFDIITLIRNFSNIGYNVCDNPGNICAYIENLERLKLIEISTMLTFTNKDVYTKLKQHPAVLITLSKNAPSPELKYEYDEKIFQLTQFGVQFINACSK